MTPEPELDYHGTVCLVTGATRGIGRAVATRLLRRGARVSACGRSPESCASLATDLADYRDNLHIACHDLTDTSAPQRILDEVAARWGRLDVLVNNAGAHRNLTWTTLRRQDWLDLIQLKLLTYWSLMVGAIPLIARQGGGAITNIAGSAGVASVSMPHVGAVNAGVVSMSEGYAKALADQRIRVNAISPGTTDTDRFAARIAELAESRAIDAHAARAALTAGLPVGHPVDPDEVARIVCLVSSPAMRSLTGAHIVVDGGETLGQRRRV